MARQLEHGLAPPTSAAEPSGIRLATLRRVDPPKPWPLTPLRARVLALCSLQIDPYEAQPGAHGTRTVSQVVAWLERSCLLRRWAPGEGWSITSIGAAALRSTFVNVCLGRHKCRDCGRTRLPPEEFIGKRGRRVQRCQKCQHRKNLR